MKTKSPSIKRKFAGDWDQIEYLYQKLLFWFYERRNRRHAAQFADRLERVLENVASDDEVIVVEECRSLICEVRGDLAGAIKYRENEIRLIRRLHQISLGTPSRDLALSQYDFGDLSERLDLLAGLYRAAGKLTRAIRVLEESKQLCATHGIPFNGRDLLRDYLQAKKARVKPKLVRKKV